MTMIVGRVEQTDRSGAAAVAESFHLIHWKEAESQTGPHSTMFRDN